jgi:hypothetical protein
MLLTADHVVDMAIYFTTALTVAAASSVRCQTLPLLAASAA